MGFVEWICKKGGGQCCDSLNIPQKRQKPLNGAFFFGWMIEGVNGVIFPLTCLGLFEERWVLGCWFGMCMDPIV